MNCPFFRRTSGSFIPERIIKRNGSILIVTAFLFLAFGALSFGLIFLSQVYLKIGGYEKHSRLLEYAAENGIKEGLHHLVSAIAKSPQPAVITEETFAELKADALGSGSLLAANATGLRFPIRLQAQEERMIWQSQIEYQLDGVADQEGFILARLSLPIQSQGHIKDLAFSRSSSLDVKAEVLAGHVPLSTIPFLLDKNLSAEEQAAFPQEGGITFLPSTGGLLPPQLSFGNEEFIPPEATPLLEKALDIEIFRPQDISTAELRSVLGLEGSQDPVPEGVYLIRNDMGLGGVYVQGDVEELVAAIEGDYQVVSFRMASGVWVLKYSPAQSRTIFSSPEGEELFDLIPLGVIIISGQVLSLGGGQVDEGGAVRLVTDQEIPSLLPGIRLTLVASDKITITSHLVQQGITWRDGIPYLKSEQAQVVLFSTGHDLWSEEGRDGGIVISGDAPEGLKVQAGLTSGGAGIILEGENKSLQLMGSIQTTEYSFSGRRLELTPWVSRPAGNGPPLLGPRTRQAVLFISRFDAAAWKEY
jgi:hypothetical protein